MGEDEWDDLPWYQQNYLLEGLQLEGILRDENSPPPVRAPSAPQRGPVQRGGTMLGMTKRRVAVKKVVMPGDV